jgi:hypothetical protein
MLEMADHIGAYMTLLLVDRFGGMRIYVPKDFTRGKVYRDRGSIREVIGDEAARKLSEIYTTEYLHIPTGRLALAQARRAPILAAVRAGRMSGNDAAKLLRTSRNYLARLVNQTREGMEDSNS